MTIPKKTNFQREIEKDSKRLAEIYNKILENEEIIK